MHIYVCVKVFIRNMKLLASFSSNALGISTQSFVKTEKNTVPTLKHKKDTLK